VNHMKTKSYTSWALTAVLASGFVLSGCSSTDKKPATDAKQAEARAAADPFDAGAKLPPKTGTLYSLSRILMSQGRDAEALTVLNNLNQRYPDFMPAYNAKAECHLRADRTQEAIDTLTAGLKRRPQDAVLLNNLGMIWFLEGNYDEALARFDAAAAAEPKEGMYVANQAMTLAMLGRDKQATALYERVTDYPTLRHNLRVLAKAREQRATEGYNDKEERRTAWGEVRPADQARAAGGQ
jgi:tetratricopeptide (TPR) repeat protein